MSYYLGIDIGTYESKGVLVDAGGDIVASAARPHKMLIPQPGWAEHRADEDWWGDFVYLSNALLRDSRIDPKAIRAVACSAIGPCMLPVDGDGNPLCNAVLYGVDNRAAAEVTELTEHYGEATLVEECGNALTAQSVGPKILWLKRQRPDLYQKAAHILTSTSFLVQKLTGKVVVDHYTAANFNPLYSLAESGWSERFNRDIIDLDRLPKILWSTEVAGTVTAGAAAETGLAEGTPVTTGTIDAAAEAISVGVRHDGDMMVMYGSTIFIIMTTAERVTDPRLWYAPWLFEGRHASMAGQATSGTLTHWFRDQLARDLTREEAFPILAEEAAASPPGANGLVHLPYFSGERTPIHDSDAKGCWFGLNLTHTRGDMFRALLEGVAYGTGHIIETYRDIGHPPAAIYAVGGGTKNPVWTGAMSDVTGEKQVLRRRTIGASYGDAFLAALAIGDVGPDDIDNWNPVATTIEPNRANEAVYARRYAAFRALYEQTKDLMAEL